MPVVIEELTTTLEIQDEVKIRELVKQEFARLSQQQRQDWLSGDAASVDPADPVAAGLADEG